MQINFFDFPIRGIDVSAYDLKLLPEKLSEKVHFVICRIGHGTKTDAKFKEFWAALKGKVFRLTYFYLDYYSNHLPDEKVFGIEDYEWGVIQGKNAWENLKEDNDYPIVYLDIENGNRSYAPEIDTVWNRVELMCDGFFDTYDKLSGITNGIYCSLSKLKQFSPRFRNRPLYLAWYNENQTKADVIKAVRSYGWTGPIHFWQYASDGDTDTDGKGDGIDFGLGRPVMDLDIWMGTEEEWNKFSKKGELMENILLNISPLAQRDSRWGGDLLGTSKTTIAGYGCLITCVTMMLNHLGWAETPGTLNVKLRDNGGFHSGNLFVWGSLSALFPGIKFAYRYSGSALDKINASLAAGMPVIVHVDYNPKTAAIDQHWVLVVGRQGDDYIINDPKDGKQLLFSSRYGVASKNIHTVCTYNYEKKETTMPETALYSVRINPGITKLIIRSTPSTSGSKLGCATELGTYPIYKVSNGYGKISTEKWISLNPSYVTKVTPTAEDGAELTDAEKLALLWQWYKEQV